MAYIFDPERNTFIDDEDKSLGNKLALVDDDELDKAIKQIDDKFGPGTVFPASELPVPENPYKDFEDRNPMAGIEDETREYYLKYLKDRPENARGGKNKIIPLKNFAPAFIKENAADGGMMRKNFADNPLKNFNITMDFPFELNKPLGKTYEIGDKSILKNLQSFDNINPNLRKNYISETTLKKILNAPGRTFQDQKYKNVGVYNKLLNVVGEPVVGEKIPGTVKNELYYDKTNLTKDAIEFIKDPKSRRIYSDDGRGKLVINDDNLKQLFIDKYNEGYGPKDILKLIDPKNKLGVSQAKYGASVAETLIANNELIKRKGQSKAHEAYTNQKIKNTDLEIEKISKIYDKNPSGSLERIAHVLAGGKNKFDGSSPRQQSEFMSRAGLRSYDFLQYLKGARPSVDENTKINVKNKNEIINVLESSKHPIYGIVKEGDVRNFKFAEIDAFFGDKRNTHQYIRRDINKLVNLQAKNVGAKNLFVIDEGPGLTTALKNGLPVLTRFSNLFNKKTNQAKIELDLKLQLAYPVVTNLDTGKQKYTITEVDVKKAKTHGIKEITEKDIGKVINKKDHPFIKVYNKFSKSFSKANKVKTPIFQFGNIDDGIDLKNRNKITKEAAIELKNMNKTYGFYMTNMGTDLKLIEQKLKDKPLKKSDFSKKAIVFKKMRDSLQEVYNSIPLKGLRVGPSTAAAVIDYNFFTNVMGIPSAEAALGAANWFTKNKDAARKIGDAIIAVTEGSLTVDEFIKTNGNLLAEITKASVESTPISKDDDVMDKRLQEMDAAMEVPNIDKTTAAPLYDYATGGRVGFNGGGAVGADDNFAKELEYFLLNPDAELPKADSYRETMNPVALLNDMIDPRNYAYYADRLAETGIRIGEFGARVLPALGQLTADLIQKPAFKITGGSSQGYVQDYDEVLPSNIKGTGIFTDFLNNLVGSEGTKVITEKTGLAELIRSEEQKQKDRRSTIGPKVLADQVTLGAELTAPIFPGLKLLKAYAKNRKLPVDNTTKEIMEKEIDEVLSAQNLTRRDFLKATGAGSAVVIAKMLGFGDELATTTKVVEKATKEAATGGVPPYFLNLVKKIKTMGDETMATKDKATAYKYDDYYMEEDFAGNIEITRKGDMDVPGYEEVYMSYRVDEVPIKGEKGSRKVEEYEEYTARPDEDGKMKDVEDGVPDDVIEEGTLFEDNMTDFNK